MPSYIKGTQPASFPIKYMPICLFKMNHKALYEHTEHTMEKNKVLLPVTWQHSFTIT